MNGNCHFIFGAAVGCAFAMNIEELSAVLPNISATADGCALFILGGLIGGIFPDIDSEGSYIGRLTVPLSTVVSKIGKATGKTKSKHRGILHDPLVYLIGLVIAYLYVPSLVGCLVGCLSHLLLDIFNPAGVPLLFGIKRLSVAKIASGSKGSIIFTWVSVFIVLSVGLLIKFM